VILRLAWRSLWRKRWRTLITVISIGLGLSIAIFFISLGEGIYSRMIYDVVRMQAGHVTLEHPAYLAAPAVDLYLTGADRLRREVAARPEVESTKLLILGQGVARSAHGATGVSIMGVEPGAEQKTSLLARRIVAGRYLSPDDTAAVVVGRPLAERLKVKVGRKMVLMTTNASGEMVQRLTRVVGVFRTGSIEMDANFIQIPLKFARKVFGLPPGSATEVGIILRRPEDQAKIERLLGRRFAGRRIAVLPWQKVLPELASYIRLDRGSNMVFQALLIFLILFTIFNTILMSILDRHREFAVLMAVGTPAAWLRRQVFTETALIGLMGCLAGVLIGGAGALATQIWGLDLRALYGQGVDVGGFAISLIVRARVTPGIILGTTGLIFGATMILCLLALRRLRRLALVDELRGN
jgi:putative ABC transport system permease protein